VNRSPIFLAAYRETGSVTQASAAAQIQRAMHYRRLDPKSRSYDPEYVAAFAEAKISAEAFLKQQALDRIVDLEDALYKRAVEGWEEPVVFQGNFTYAELDDEGNPVGKPVSVRKFSDSDAQFLLRGLKPETYRERFSHDVNAKVAHRFEGTLEDLLTTYRALTADDSKA